MSEPSRARSYHFHPQAQTELTDETGRLREEDAAISRAFEEETSRAMGILLDHPESAPVIIEREGRRIRSKVLRRFHYSLVYALIADDVFILAVAHQRRRPLYWIDRV